MRTISGHVTLLTYPQKMTLYPKCPGCQHSFTSLDFPVGKLVFVVCGCENFLAAPVELVKPDTIG